MQKKNIFIRLLNFFENSFMKNHSCICCYHEIPDETKFMICEKCAKDIEFLSGDLCPKCGDKLKAGGKCINDCNKQKYAFSRNVSLCYYVGSAAKLVKNLKYGKKKYIAENVAEMILELFEKIGDVDIITFVPMSKARIKSRGFNQAETIANCLGEKLNIKVLPLLNKVKETLHQAGGTQIDRMKNLAGSFAVSENYESEVENKTILIIDDVFTTGSTLNECAKTLKKFKPKRIYTMTFAKTKFNLTAEDTVVI